jgi:hypothetical protein
VIHEHSSKYNGSLATEPDGGFVAAFPGINIGHTALVIGIVPLPPLIEHIADLIPVSPSSFIHSKIHVKNLTHLNVGFGLGHDLDRAELEVLLLTENYQRLRGREIKFKKTRIIASR